MCACMYVRMYACTYLCMCVCTYVRTYVCVCVCYYFDFAVYCSLLFSHMLQHIVLFSTVRYYVVCYALDMVLKIIFIIIVCTARCYSRIVLHSYLFYHILYKCHISSCCSVLHCPALFGILLSIDGHHFTMSFCTSGN